MGHDYGSRGCRPTRSSFTTKTGIIYVPADLVKDTTFPFVSGDLLLIRIDGERLIVEKASKRKRE